MVGAYNLEGSVAHLPNTGEREKNHGKKDAGRKNHMPVPP
jgi:hypothetical protein